MIYISYIIYFKNIITKNEYFVVEKNTNYNKILNHNINDNAINLFFYKLFLKTILLNNIKIHYGKFEIVDKNFIELIEIISSPSNLYEKITIVEGWNKFNLNQVLKTHFKEFQEIEYGEIIADTYHINYDSPFHEFKKELKNNFKKINNKYKDNKLLEKFSFNEILIIASLLEKEGIDYNDKKKIYSVIINRLNKKMKLQIDATVIYSLTNGRYIFDRKLTYKDLKNKSKFNTYYIYGLPPAPISYVGLKTIELIFENYNTNYLFYFYNKYENKHIYSEDYKQHLAKLNEYRSK